MGCATSQDNHSGSTRKHHHKSNRKQSTAGGAAAAAPTTSSSSSAATHGHHHSHPIHSPPANPLSPAHHSLRGSHALPQSNGGAVHSPIQEAFMAVAAADPVPDTIIVTSMEDSDRRQSQARLASLGILDKPLPPALKKCDSIASGMSDGTTGGGGDAGVRKVSFNEEAAGDGVRTSSRHHVHRDFVNILEDDPPYDGEDEPVAQVEIPEQSDDHEDADTDRLLQRCSR